MTYNNAFAIGLPHNHARGQPLFKTSGENKIPIKNQQAIGNFKNC
jgi:hypothetical protein